MEDSSIKSARRTLQIFELFAELRRPATVTEIYRRLDVPQSSISKLLRNLAALGYLQYDRYARTYVPTLRTAVLSGWLHDQWFTNGGLLRLMESLREKLGTSVILGIQNDRQVLYMLALQATFAPRPALSIGTLRPICKAAVGKALLMTKTDKEIGLLVWRINAEEAGRNEPLDLAALMLDIEESRQRGYTLSRGAVVPGVSVLAVPLPEIPGHPPMALGIGSVGEWMEQNIDRCRDTLLEVLGDTLKLHKPSNA